MPYKTNTKMIKDLLESFIANPELDVNVRARGTLDQAIRRLVHRVIKEGLVRTGWNKSQLARELGVSRTTLIKKIREHHLEQTGPATG